MQRCRSAWIHLGRCGPGPVAAELPTCGMMTVQAVPSSFLLSLSNGFSERVENGAPDRAAGEMRGERDSAARLPLASSMTFVGSVAVGNVAHDGWAKDTGICELLLAACLLSSSVLCSQELEVRFAPIAYIGVGVLMKRDEELDDGAPGG